MTGLEQRLTISFLPLAFSGTDAEPNEEYLKALAFLKSSKSYRPDHVLRHLPDDELYEARAILLGRLGNHDGALQIYVYRLADYAKAEE